MTLFADAAADGDDDDEDDWMIVDNNLEIT
jgi:hypothetical protein